MDKSCLRIVFRPRAEQARSARCARQQEAAICLALVPPSPRRDPTDPQRAPRMESFLLRHLDRVENAQQSPFVIYRAASTDKTVGDNSAERRLGPSARSAGRHQHHNLMGHQQDKFQTRVGFLTCVEKRRAGHRFDRQGFVEIWKSLL